MLITHSSAAITGYSGGRVLARLSKPSLFCELLGRGQVRSGALGGGFTFKLAPFRPEDRGTYDIGLYPIVTFQYISTTLYQVSYHIQYLFF
jgi:hypothetical protein